MTTEVDRFEALRLIAEEDAQLVDVLPPREYEALHLPRAINLPLRTLNRDTAAVLPRDRPLVVY